MIIVCMMTKYELPGMNYNMSKQLVMMITYPPPRLFAARPAPVENSLGQGSGTTLLTNEDILRIADPSTNPTMPYIYDNYNSWGTCSDWDPCTECT